MAESEGGHRHGLHHAGQPAPHGFPASDETPASPWLSIPWIAISAITAGFHFYRGVPVDGWIFLTMAVALAADLLWRRRKTPTRPGAAAPARARRPHQLRAWVLGVGLAAVALIVWAVLMLAPEQSIGVPAVVGLVGVVMAVLAWPDPPQTRSRAEPRERRAAYWWAAVVLFLCIWELGTYFIDRFAPAEVATFPPLTDLLQPLFDGDSSRWFMTGLWLVACGAMVRTGRRT